MIFRSLIFCLFITSAVYAGSPPAGWGLTVTVNTSAPIEIGGGGVMQPGNYVLTWSSTTNRYTGVIPGGPAMQETVVTLDGLSGTLSTSFFAGMGAGPSSTFSFDGRNYVFANPLFSGVTYVAGTAHNFDNTPLFHSEAWSDVVTVDFGSGATLGGQSLSGERDFTWSDYYGRYQSAGSGSSVVVMQLDPEDDSVGSVSLLPSQSSTVPTESTDFAFNGSDFVFGGALGGSRITGGSPADWGSPGSSGHAQAVADSIPELSTSGLVSLIFGRIGHILVMAIGWAFVLLTSWSIYKAARRHFGSLVHQSVQDWEIRTGRRKRATLWLERLGWR